VRFPGATIILGPECVPRRVMGLDDDLGIAFAKTQATVTPAHQRHVFLSVKDADKPQAVEPGASSRRSASPSPPTALRKPARARDQGAGAVQDRRGRPTVIDMIKNGHPETSTPVGMIPRKDENKIRSAAYAHAVCLMTTITGAAPRSTASSAQAETPRRAAAQSTWVRRGGR